MAAPWACGAEKKTHAAINHALLFVIAVPERRVAHSIPAALHTT
jgi:hypothetical protein